MRRRNLLASAAMMVLAGCGGDASSGGGAVAITPTPSSTPTPTPTPTATPTPTPTPETGQATISFPHVFGIDPTDGAQPNGPLLLASDGNLYGTTRAGGGTRCLGNDNFCGVVFKVTPDGVETVVHRFTENPLDGAQPTGPLIQGKDSALYGMTTLGGQYARGTAFRLTLDGTYSTLHSFGSSTSDGSRPQGALFAASDGYLYGATIGGGPNICTKSGGDCGTIFRIRADSDYKTIYSFGASETDGAVPNGSLIESTDGSLYGTTRSGGDLTCQPFNASSLRGCGTIFKMTLAGSLTTLYAFGAIPADGVLPGPLTKGGDGSFYGTTYGGGGGRCTSDTPGCGTVFRITTAGVKSTLYAFAQSRTDGISPQTDGFNPQPFLFLSKDGNFYGLTESGGNNIATRYTGTMFRLTSFGVKTTLYSFGPYQENPSSPVDGLAQLSNGSFYGVTNYNGKLGATGDRTGGGAIFKAVLP